MSLKIINEEPADGTLTIQLDNGDYRVLKEIVDKWNFKDRENALRYALAILNYTNNGLLCKKQENGTHSILAPTDEILKNESVSEDWAMEEQKNKYLFENNAMKEEVKIRYGLVEPGNKSFSLR